MNRAFVVPALCLAVSLTLVPAALAQTLEERYQRGLQALQGGRTLEAVDQLESVVAENGDFGDARMMLGQAYLIAGMARQAKPHFEAAFKAQPKNGQAAFMLGYSLYEAARWVEAVEVFDQAETIFMGRNPLPFVYRGLSRLKLGDPKTARQDIDRALALASREITARAAAAELELAEGQYEAAEKHLRELVTEAPRNIEYHLLLARTLYESGQPAEALPVLRRLAGGPLERSDVLYLLGQSLLRSGQRDEGREILARFRARKERESRVRLLQSEVSTDPSKVEARIELAGMLIEDGQWQAAAVHVQVLRGTKGDDPRVKRLSEELLRKR